MPNTYSKLHAHIIFAVKGRSNFIQTICMNFMTEIEFRVRRMPHLRRLFLMRHPYTPRKCCAFPWGYGYAAPKRGWFIALKSVELKKE